MARPGVTIAIPNWNHELFLPRSIASALAAVKELRRHDLGGEVLVVDDQSRDGSRALLRQLEALYFDQGLRVLALARNGGVCQARNRALHRAAYRHVMVMDADNEVIPENVAVLHRAMEDTGAAIVYGNLLLHPWQDNVTRLCSNQTFQPKIFGENYIDNFSMLDRDQVLALTQGYSPDPRVQALGDWEFFLSIAANGGKIVFVPVVIGNYYFLPGSMMQEAIGQNAKEIALIRRTFDQIGVRQRLPSNSCRLRYHPDIGYC
jgi:glycosyltransferase involved in cell wall biosynthesis